MSPSCSKCCLARWGAGCLRYSTDGRACADGRQRSASALAPAHKQSRLDCPTSRAHLAAKALHRDWHLSSVLGWCLGNLNTSSLVDVRSDTLDAHNGQVSLHHRYDHLSPPPLHDMIPGGPHPRSCSSSSSCSHPMPLPTRCRAFWPRRSKVPPPRCRPRLLQGDYL